MRTHQPFVRYRIGDLAAWGEQPCGCGRGLPVISEIVGRIEDVVVGPDGRRMVRFHGLYLGLPRIRAGQVVQERIDRIRVRIVPDVGFGAHEVEEIERRLRQRLGDVEVVVEEVAELPRTRSGKVRAVVSRLDDAERVPREVAGGGVDG